MKKGVIISLVFLLVLSCNKKDFFDGPNFYEDGFEGYSELSDLLVDDDIFWSFTQLTSPSNNVLVDTVNFHSGGKSLRFSGVKSTVENLSKCSIAKQKMAFWEGETIRVTAWYYLQGTDSYKWLFLMDIEEQTAIGAGPGMRLALVNNQLRIEHKYNEKDLVQLSGQELDFPRDQWVKLVWEVRLSQKNKGSVRLWQNEQMIINTTDNRTLPRDILYSLQGTKGMYSSVEIGITANSKDNDLILWVDDFRVDSEN